jgi:hypothetical protein
MPLTITNRPEKTLQNGYLSRWNASRTPLNYKFKSDLFPVNEVDATSAIQSFVYDSSLNGTKLEYLTPPANVVVGNWVKVEGTNKIDGVYKVKSFSGSYVVIDLFTNETESSPLGTYQRYYKGYKGLAKVYAGAPSYHPYNTDSSKPLTEIGTIEIEFGSDNKGIANVRNFIKPDMTADFDNADDNSHFAWTSFNIEYTEIWDNQEFPIPYSVDILDNCTPFSGLLNPSFDSGLTDWSVDSADISWTTGTSEIIANGLGGSSQRETDTVKQNIDLRANVPYQIEVNYNLVSGTVSDVYNFVVVAKPVGGTEEAIYTARILELGTGVGLIDYTPTFDVEYIGFKFFPQALFPQTFEFKVQYFQITTSVLDQCEYSSFSIFGAKQFQDSLGGNFGDYIADSQLQGKLLTHFNTLTYPYYINSIIPNSTFNRSEGNDSIFLDEKVFDAKRNEKESTRTKIENKSDGVYTVDSGITVASNEWSSGTAQIISIPSNLLLDGDNGTFENADPNLWNISSINVIAGNMTYGSGGPTGNYGIYNISYSLLNVGEYTLYQYDTPIQTQIGEAYTFNADGLTMNNFAPNLVGNAVLYYRIKGTNFISNKFEFKQNGPQETKFQIDFDTTASSYQVEFILEVVNDITSSGGGSFGVDNVTFKGPIEYLTEVKTIKPSSSCSVKYNTKLRWKNDLGGWEQWNFNRYRTFNETVSNRNEIRRDVTQDFDNYFINGSTEYDTINMDVRKSVTLRSGLLTENDQINLNQIRRSIKIQVEINGTWTTVTTKPNTFLLTDESEYMREVSFDVYLPNTLVQEQ